MRPASARRASSRSCDSRATEQGVGWLEGRTLSFGRSISYWPFLEIVQQDAGIDSDDGEAERWSKLTARLTGLFGDQASEVLPYLATLLSVPLPEELAPKVELLDGEAMGHQLYRASRLYFTRLAEEKPLVVAFEDVHWLDASSAALLEHLLPLIDELPLLLLLRGAARARHGAHPDRSNWRAPLTPSERRRLRCSRSRRAESETLVHNLVDLDELPPGCATSSSPRPRATPSSSRRSCAASSTSAPSCVTARRAPIA